MTNSTTSSNITARTNLLRSRTHAFCQAFVTGNPSGKSLAEFFVPTNPQITEHGPSWASARLPFLGRTFSGRSRSNSNITSSSTSTGASSVSESQDTDTDTDSFGSGFTCDDYFELLSRTLSFHPDAHTFPPREQFIVDAEAGAVSVVAHARFASVKTGQGWEEDFIYRLSGFDEVGRIGHWEIWADPLSAWVAVGDKWED